MRTFGGVLFANSGKVIFLKIRSQSNKGWPLATVDVGNRYSGHYRGWIETYWTPMQEILANGAISDETRARVKTDKTQRIRRGQFRRRLSK